MNLPGLAGERNSVGLMSPMPKALSMPGKRDGWLMIGRIVRVIRFQRSLSEIGMTGWTFMIQIISWSGPAPKLKLF
jgi:hypothetical protein